MSTYKNTTFGHLNVLKQHWAKHYLLKRVVEKSILWWVCYKQNKNEDFYLALCQLAANTHFILIIYRDETFTTQKNYDGPKVECPIYGRKYSHSQ